MGHENETVGGGYSKMKEDVVFRLKQAETAGWVMHFPPRSPMLSVLSVKKQNLKLKTQRKLLNREG
jgi:hypothetical protein